MHIKDSDGGTVGLSRISEAFSSLILITVTFILMGLQFVDSQNDLVYRSCRKLNVFRCWSYFTNYTYVVNRLTA